MSELLVGCCFCDGWFVVPAPDHPLRETYIVPQPLRCPRCRVRIVAGRSLRAAPFGEETPALPAPAPAPAPKHDGNLPAGRHGNTYLVKHTLRLRHPALSDVYIGHEETSNDEVWLTPNQALSLLAWLLQEEAELQRLAKEQEG